MTTDDQVELANESCPLLADPTRVEVLGALLRGASSRSGLADLIGATPTGSSQYLAHLSRAEAKAWLDHPDPGQRRRARP